MPETVNYFAYHDGDSYIRRHESSYNVLYHLVQVYPENIYYFPEE